MTEKYIFSDSVLSSGNEDLLLSDKSLAEILKKDRHDIIFRAVYEEVMNGFSECNLNAIVNANDVISSFSLFSGIGFLPDIPAGFALSLFSHLFNFSSSSCASIRAKPVTSWRDTWNCRNKRAGPALLLVCQ